MKKKLMALLLCSVTAVMLAACGSSNEGSTSEEKVYLEDSQIQQLFTDPEQFKGKYAKLSGVLLANPEADSDGSPWLCKSFMTRKTTTKISSCTQTMQTLP